MANKYGLASIPEPASLALLAVGAVALFRRLARGRARGSSTEQSAMRRSAFVPAGAFSRSGMYMQHTFGR